MVSGTDSFGVARRGAGAAPITRWLLQKSIKEGALRLIEANGTSHHIGAKETPVCTLRLTPAFRDWRMAFGPDLYIGEAYMEGHYSLEDGDLRGFLDLMGRNVAHIRQLPAMRLFSFVGPLLRWIATHNPVGRARQNVAHHYDLSSELYDLFLDPDRQYSCAYFATPDMTLEEAQAAKKRHIAAKLCLDRPGLEVLDIGSGWGGLGLMLAETAKAKVTGVTLSVEQHKLSCERAEERGLAERARFHLRDYRDQTGTFDRIVSVGMFEHVGRRHFDEYFGKLASLLRDDGVFLLHAIGNHVDRGPINPFMRKYIFPGADLPTLSEVLPAAERAGLLVTDIEVLRLHYAETLRHWHERVLAKWDRIAALYDQRFCRMWEFYLVGCEMGFRHMGLMVFQIQGAKRVDAVPLTRDYIAAAEARGGLAAPKLDTGRLNSAE